MKRTGRECGAAAPDLAAVERHGWGAIHALRNLITMAEELRADGHLDAASEVIAACRRLSAGASTLVEIIVSHRPAMQGGGQ